MSGWRNVRAGRLGTLLVVALIVLASCSSGSELTMEDFNKLQLEMPISEAEKILGLEFEDQEEVELLGLPLTTGRFGPADGPHIGVIAQDFDGGLEIRQLDWVEDGETVCIRNLGEDTCPG